MNRRVVRQERIEVDGIVAEVAYKRVRRLTLRVKSSDGPVQMTVPSRVSRQTVKEFLQKQIPWIRKQQQRHKERELVPPPTYAEGETIWMWGRRLVIERVDAMPPCVTPVGESGLRLQIAADATPDECGAVIEEWLRGQLAEAIEPLLETWSERLGLEVPRYRIRKMKSRWGSCSLRTRTLTFNLELIRRAPTALEYVVVHELVHLIVPPHTWAYAIPIASCRCGARPPRPERAPGRDAVV